MTKRLRTTLFFVFVFLFLFLVPLTILYSLGYRVDLNLAARRIKISQSGAFYFRVSPKQAEIYLQGKPKKKTDWFFGAALVENLLPQKYQIEIKKEGFFSWKKDLEIKEKMVTEAKNIVLIPKNPNFKIVVQDLNDFFFSPDGEKIILKKEGKDGWHLALLELPKNIQSFILEKKGEILNLKWSADSKKILLETLLEEEPKNYVLEIEKTPAKITSLDFLGKDIEAIFFNPRNSKELFFLKNGGLYKINLDGKKIEGPLLEKIITYKTSNSNLYFLDNSGFLQKADLSLSSKEKINNIPFSLKEETEYKIYAFEPYIFLKEGDALYSLNEDSKSFEKFSESAKELKLSPDRKKILFFNDNEIWLLFLSDIYEQPERKAGEKVFLTRFSGKIDNVFWFGNYYLIFNVGNQIRTMPRSARQNLDSSLSSEIKIAEIDTRDRINIVDLAEFKSPKIFWNDFNNEQDARYIGRTARYKKLYILSEKNLYQSETLLP